ncbi:ABC transporter permease [Mucilaginibacter sp. OK098]|uniref:ABC transporter permease n=1 Tax=Mucilaginibacter sp. OK098 TaxID=1855297 RepID=UPI00091407DC|nr:ABC transporter permease [Mucilaginibacter sp. OK098]SHM07572.1 putative ABC transport system permease protein [Mucilaginibacter sp. OK098]
MLKINLKLAFRNIFRNKLYTTINIIGLSVASAFCILVYLYVKNEQSFDSFHHDRDQLYRLEETNLFGSFDQKKSATNFFSFLMKDAEQKNSIQTPTVLAPDLKSNFPEIENAIRLSGIGEETIKVGNNNFKEQGDNLTFADADFFQVFNYPLISGNSKTVLTGRNQVVISERLAEKYFGRDNAVGKIISLPNETGQPPLTVSGVFKNFPANSSFQFDMIIPMETNTSYKDKINRGVNSLSDRLVLKLKKGTDLVKLKNKLDVFAKQYFKPLVESMKKYDPKKKPGDMHIFLRLFADAHYNQAEGWYHYTNLKNIYQLVCLAVIILLIACLNYILLTLTNAISRSQDVGVRKTIGAGRKQIVLQYYTETQLLAFIAVIAGFLLSVICLPLFGTLTGTNIVLSNFSLSTIGLFLFVLAIVLGLMSGVYPAIAMSGLKPLNIMRGFSAYRISPFLSKSLVVIQFAICMVLVISTLAINKQMHYINASNMGFDKDQVLVLQSPYSWFDKPKTEVLKQRLYNYAVTEPAIQDITSTSFSFGVYSSNGVTINGEKVVIQDLNVDYNYFSFLKIPIVEGRSFSRNVATDSAKLALGDLKKSHNGMLIEHAVVVNESLYNLLGKPKLDVINETLGSHIIGVCKDYHTNDLTQEIVPAYHTINVNSTGNFWIKIKAGQSIPNTINRIKANWNQLTGNLPFSYTFMDEDVAKGYDAYLRWMTTITTSCILAIIIACLGLFGLSGLTTINRTKEIGIRKVLGASVSNLFLLLNRGTIVLAAASFIIAAPVAFYLVHQWLDNFAYRINPDWILFTTAGIIAMLTAVIAVSYHTIKAAMGNPVNSLRSE